MNSNDLKPFGAALSGMLAVLSHGKAEPGADVVRVWFRTLEPYTLAQVLAGFDGHMRAPLTARTLPIPSDIVAQITAMSEQDGRPGPEEAWAIALQSMDEAQTVIWTEEIAQARAVAHALLPDRVAGRMAFVEGYKRLVAEARAKRQPAKWSASVGQDPRQRDAAIATAVQAGLLTHEALAALPGPAQVASIDALALPAPKDSEAARKGRAALASTLVNLKEWQDNRAREAADKLAEELAKFRALKAAEYGAQEGTA